MFIGFLIVTLTLYAAMYTYVYRRLTQAFLFPPLARRLLLPAMVLLVVLPFVGRHFDHNGNPTLAKVVNLPAYVWLVWVFWFCTAGWCVDLWNLMVRPLRVHPRLHCFVCVAFILITTAWGLVEASRLSVRTLNFTVNTMPPGAPPLRIVHISDVHLGTIRNSGWDHAIIDRVRSLNPDLVVSTGDFIDSSTRNVGPLAEAWADVRPPLGKYAVLGNHEFYAGIVDAIDLHRKAGFHLLRGNGMDANADVRLYGVDDWAGLYMGVPASTSEDGLPPRGSTTPFTILLKHQPRIDAFSRDRFDLQLSGHTHGAQVFPFHPVVHLIYPLTAGLFDVGQRSRIFVSRGAGTWGPPLRVLAPPEITHIILSAPRHGTTPPSAHQALAGTDAIAIRTDHPRLLINGNNWAAMKARIESYGPEGHALLARLKAVADRSLKEPMPKPLPENGDWLAEARASQRRLVSLSLAWRFFDAEAYLKRAVAESRHVCAYESWYPDHFLDVAETALAVALAYDWLYDALTPEDREAIKAGLMKNALVFADPVYNEVRLDEDPADRRLWWARRKSNWSQVCHAGLLASALALAEDQPDLAQMVVRGVTAYLPTSMKAYEPQGAYPEGPGYWSYGTTFNVLAIAMLESATGNNQGLGTAVPAFEKTAPYRLQMDSPSHLIFNYADAQTSWESAISPAFVFLAERYRQPVCTAFAWQRMQAEFARRPPEKEISRFFPYYFFWLPPKPAQTPVSLPVDAHYAGEADVAVFRSRWGDANAIYAGLKAGFNGAGHGHLDQGSFILDADGFRWSADLGNDDYGLPGYFGPQRWSYLRLNNLGHSTLLINRQKQDPKAVCPIVRFESTPARALAVIDLKAAHPDLVSQWRRGFFFLDRNRLTVEDELEGLPESAVLEWQMITPAEIEIVEGGRRAVLKQSGRTLEAMLVEPAGLRFEVAEPRPQNLRENPNQGYRILVARGKAERARARILVVLRPLGAKWPSAVPKPVWMELNS